MIGKISVMDLVVCLPSQFYRPFQFLYVSLMYYSSRLSSSRISFDWAKLNDIYTKQINAHLRNFMSRIRFLWVSAVWRRLVIVLKRTLFRIVTYI